MNVVCISEEGKTNISDLWNKCAKFEYRSACKHTFTLKYKECICVGSSKSCLNFHLLSTQMNKIQIRVVLRIDISYSLVLEANRKDYLKVH